MREWVMIPKEKLIGWKIEASQIFNECNHVDLDTTGLWKLLSGIFLELDVFVLKPKIEDKEN